MDYKLDENGKFSDDNELIRSINEWYDKDEYDKIINGILGVPRELWSTDLRRYLISAYNNLEQFDKSWKELKELKPMCDTPELEAAYYYLCGYIYYRQDKDMMAISCYNDGKAADPEDTGERDFDSLIEESRKYIASDLKKLEQLSEQIYNDIKKVCAEKPEKEKHDLSEEEFTMLLGFLPGIRKVPGMDHSPGFDEYFIKYEGKDKQCVLDFFKNMFNVTDRDSFHDLFTKYVGCNISNIYNDVPPYLAGKPNFDISELNDIGREAFMNAVEFFKPFVKYLPNAGVLAWDICEKVGFARLAYSCDIIGNTDYCTIMMMLTDLAQANFSSFEEYLLSLAFGCGVYMFHIDEWSIAEAMKFMRQMMPLLLQGDLPYVKWMKKKGRPSKDSYLQ